jgi:hypothetical protein
MICSVWDIAHLGIISDYLIFVNQSPVFLVGELPVVCDHVRMVVGPTSFYSLMYFVL